MLVLTADGRPVRARSDDEAFRALAPWGFNVVWLFNGGCSPFTSTNGWAKPSFLVTTIASSCSTARLSR